LPGFPLVTELAVALFLVVVVVLVVMVAAFTLLLKLAAALFRLAAVFAVPADGFLQFAFRFVNSLFAFAVTIAVAIMVVCLGHSEAAEHKAKRQNCSYDSLVSNHSTSCDRRNSTSSVREKSLSTGHAEGGQPRKSLRLVFGNY
jgi:hypothetical protein